MAWEINVVSEFTEWYQGLDDDTVDSVDAVVELLEQHGPSLGFPHSSAILGTRRHALRELRRQHKGDPIRILYAFDPAREAVLLLGGIKTGDDRWYEKHVPTAERLMDDYLRGLS